MPFRNSTDLLLIFAVTVAAVLAFILNVNEVIVRTLFALLLLFLFPGYAVVSALFATKRLSLETHLVFSLALSISIAGGGGLILHFSGSGLNPQSWLLFLSGITLVAGVIALMRRPRTTGAPRLALNFSLSQFLMIGLALVLVVAAVRIAQDGALQQPTEGFTQLWMLPSEDSAEQVELGIRNQELGAVDYRLLVTLNDEVVEEWDTITLAADETWTTQIAIPQISTDNTLNALLYRLDETTTVYRSVALRLTP